MSLLNTSTKDLDSIIPALPYSNCYAPASYFNWLTSCPKTGIGNRDETSIYLGGCGSGGGSIKFAIPEST